MTAALVGSLLALYGVADSRNHLGNELQSQARYQEAEASYRLAISISEHMALPEFTRGAVTNNLATLLQRRGRYDEAERCYKDAIRMWKDAPPKFEVDLARATANLGALYMNRGRLDESVTLLEHARAIQERVHDDALAHTLVTLANLELLRTDYPRTGQLLDAARSVLKNNGALRDVEIYWGVTRCGYLSGAGRPADALAACDEARSRMKLGLGDSHPQMATLEMRTAQANVGAGDFEAAAESYRRAAMLYSRTVGDKSSAYARALIGMASARRAQKQYPAALAQARRAVEILDACGDNSIADRITALQVAADLSRLMGNMEDAEAAARSALADAERSRGQESLLVSDVLNTLGVILQTSPSRLDEASRALERSLAIRLAKQGPSHPGLAEIEGNLGYVRLAQGRPQEASVYFERALALRQQVTGTMHPSLVPWLEAYASALGLLHRKDDVKWARSVVRRIAGEPHPYDPGSQVMTFAEYKRLKHN